MNENTEGILLGPTDFPAIVQAADRNSMRGQRRFLWATRIRLGMLVVAALAASFVWIVGNMDLAGVISACAFGVALGSELYLLKVRPERMWYEGRAAAESGKTLAWRYLAGGAPLAKDRRPERKVEEQFLNRLKSVAEELPGVLLVPVAESDQITEAMRDIRAKPFARRREAYRTGRIHEQRRWYGEKARWNERRAIGWSIGLAGTETVAIVGATLKAVSILTIDLLGVAGALGAAVAAWVLARQHQNLASAYSIAAQELSDISSRIDWPMTEDQWSHFVDQAEEAISREHTLWRASHS